MKERRIGVIAGREKQCACVQEFAGCVMEVYCAPLVPNTDSIHGAGNAVPRASPMRSRTELSHTLLLGGAGATTAAGVAAAALCSRATGSEVFTPPSNTFSATGGFIADAELEMSPKARLRSRGRGTAESHARSQAGRIV